MHELKDTNQTIVFSDIGGSIVSWVFKGEEIFFPQQELVISGEKKLRGGMPICFPNFGDAPAEFGLPKHGLLRTLRAAEVKSDGVVIRSEELFGPTNKVACEVKTTITLREKGFDFSLTARTLGASTALFINPGFHPYFRTPKSKVEIATTQGVISVDQSPYGPTYESVAKVMNLSIDGIGSIRIETSGAWDSLPERNAGVWRDMPEYLCVEPMLTLPEDYGSPKCARLTEGFEMTCRFGVAPPQKPH